tara:strand:- start:25373 stop:25714 length:342 start_codon:yes stop_codon:yes gene_type:complete
MATQVDLQSIVLPGRADDPGFHLATWQAGEGEIERQYVAWFQQPGIAEACMDQQVEAIVSKILRTAPCTGFRGGINWYRNIDHNALAHPTVGGCPAGYTLPDVDGRPRPGSAA